MTLMKKKKVGGFKKYQSLFYFLLATSHLRDVPNNNKKKASNAL
jgi:hypothetical protein